MAQRNRHKPLLSARLSPWQAVLLLCVFLAARGLVPAGFMPAAIAAGTPYDLCHGDSRSALLLNALSRQHSHQGHQGEAHQHGALTAQAFADNHCSFSAGATIAAAPTLELPSLTAGAQPAPDSGLRLPLLRRHYLLPPKRGPPFSRSA